MKFKKNNQKSQKASEIMVPCNQDGQNFEKTNANQSWKFISKCGAKIINFQHDKQNCERKHEPYLPPAWSDQQNLESENRTSLDVDPSGTKACLHSYHFPNNFFIETKSALPTKKKQ